MYVIQIRSFVNPIDDVRVGLAYILVMSLTISYIPCMIQYLIDVHDSACILSPTVYALTRLIDFREV